MLYNTSGIKISERNISNESNSVILYYETNIVTFRQPQYKDECMQIAAGTLK